jgi:iron complex outermembrane receptor protein
VSNTPVDPEKLTAYELGTKLELAGNRLRVNAAIFEYQYKDIQVSVVSGFTTEDQNAAKVTIRGAEFDFALQATSDLTLRAGVSYLHARYDSYPNAIAYVPNTNQSLAGDPSALVTPAGGLDLSGNVMPRAPTLTSTVGFDYVVPLPVGSLLASGTSYHSDKFYFEAADTASTGPYELVNASVAYRSSKERWTATVWGNNLTARIYLETNIDSQFGTADEYAPPLTFGLRPGYKSK